MRRPYLPLLCLALSTGCGAEAEPLSGGGPCGTAALEADILVAGIDAVDLLIVIDDSAATAGERAFMQRKVSELVQRLLPGDGPDGPRLTPGLDLHVGVVSADLGASGSSDAVPGCQDWGEQGALASGGAGDGCAARALPYSRYRTPRPTVHPLIEPPFEGLVNALLDEVECAAAEASTTCEFGQPLEAMLRALWPANERPWHGAAPAFDGPPPEGEGANAGFLRSDPSRGVSLVQVLLVTDGDDCSARDPAVFGDDDAAASAEARCADSDELLHAVDRYVAGLRALRPGDNPLVSFAAVAGVPPDLVRGQGLHGAEGSAFYDALLADPRMQPTSRADGTLAPSCESAEISATPPRRVVELAGAFGPLGRVRSICDDDWSAALLPLTGPGYVISPSVCLPRRFPRDRDGLVPCRIFWELPRPEDAPEDTPTSCDERAFLSPLAERPENDRGGAVCEVQQLAVHGAPDDPQLEPGGGWFYDDFGDGAHCECPGGCNSIFFAPHMPEPGIVVKLQCQETHRALPPAADLECEDGRCPEGWSCNADRVCEPDVCSMPG